MFFFDKTRDRVPEDYVMVNMENAQKDNSFSPYSILLMYKDMINAGKLPETAIKYILEYLQNYEEMISEDYKEYIKEIYSALMYIRYREEKDYIDPELIFSMANSIIYLTNDLKYSGILKLINFDRLCYEAYYELAFRDFKKEIKFDETRYIEEEFKPKHILDFHYHVESIKRWCEGEEDSKYLKDLFEIINDKVWRFLQYAKL